MSEDRDPFLHLKESNGSLMFLWCRLDDALSDALEDRARTVRRKMGGSFHERLLRLKSVADRELKADPTRAAKMCDLLIRLDNARRQRNLIVHSLSGVCADPVKGEPHLTCENNGEPVRITQRALTALLEEMDRCRQQLGRVSNRSGLRRDDPNR